MITLQELILGSNLDEGLIKTYPSNATCKILNRDKEFKKRFVAFEKDEYSVRINFKKKSLEPKNLKEWFILEDYVGAKQSDWIDYLLKKMNLFGYLPNFYNIFDGVGFGSPVRFNYNKLCKAIDDEISDSTLVDIYFSAKYSKVKKDNIPTEVYHLSKQKHRQKISSVGLVSKGNSRYDERIYIVLNRESLSDKFLSNMKNSSGEKTLDLYKINIDGLDIKLYKDPEYKEYGYYVKVNISPDRIKLIGNL